MSVCGRRRTSLQPYGAAGLPHGPRALHFMIDINLSLQTSGTFNGDLEQSQHLTPTEIVQEGNDGIRLQVTVLDDAGRPVNLHDASNLFIYFLKPDLLTTPAHPEYNKRPAVLTTNGFDGRMYIDLAGGGDGDLNQVGYYRAQGLFTIASQAKTTFRGAFVVKPNLPDTTIESTVFVNQMPC